MEQDNNNIIYIEFLNKRNFPIGAWLREPDFIQWKSYGFICLGIRDMRMGMWRGFVGVGNGHPAYNKAFSDLICEDQWLSLRVHGGIASVGNLPSHYKELGKNQWWIGFECTQGNDKLPLIELDLSDAFWQQMNTRQIYRDIVFLKKETDNLAKQLSKIK